MKFSALSIGLFASGALAAPSKVDPRGEAQTAHLTFRAAEGPETYALAVKADGSTVETANNGAAAGHDGLVIGLVDAPDYLASDFCKLETPGEVTISTRLAADNVTTQLVLQPPQPVLRVRCQGMCVPTLCAFPCLLPRLVPRVEGDLDESLLTSCSRVLQERPARGALLQRRLHRQPLPLVEYWAPVGD
ncbi:Uncharacterized protein TPAR_01315 [Tolypocladium paradoxum]|uniref:Uncharacterized protein n=1 Tax=Tolypocladium paradoxum TaxID=94208 RepID=A0A2S4L7R6_9HYPO|nr:Uncharacterized protein TPAR_01315 [Tolypocladium paradoxum]